VTEWQPDAPEDEEPSSSEEDTVAAERSGDVPSDGANDAPGRESPQDYPWETCGAPADEQAPADNAFEVGNGPTGPPQDPGPPGRRPSRGPVVVAGLLVMCLAGLGAFTFKLWTDHAKTRQALASAVDAISVTVDPELAGPIAGRLDRVRAAIEQGSFVEAASRLDNLTMGADIAPPGGDGQAGIGQPFGGPGMRAGPGGQGRSGALRPGQGRPDRGGPGAARTGPRQGAPAAQLPPEAIAFFDRNPELAKVLAQANLAGIRLRESGADVTKLREFRDAVVEAARLDDAEGVRKALEGFQKEFAKQASRLGGRRQGMPQRRPGGRRPQRPKAPPRGLMATARQAAEALKKAQAEGKDVRGALQLMRQAEQAGAAGDFATATKLTRQALSAIKQAPQIPPRPEMFRNPLVQMFLDMMRVEDEQLAGTLQTLRAAYDDTKTRTLQAMGSAMKSAIDGLALVGHRRLAFGQQLKQMQGERTQALSREQFEAQARERMAGLRPQIGGILQRAQVMTPEEFAANRDSIIDEVLDAVFPMRRPRRGPRPKAPEALAVEQALPVADRVRSKLLRAAEPYLKVKADPEQQELATQLGDVFRRARALLTDGKHEEAELLVDKGLALLGVDVPREASEAFGPESEGEPRLPILDTEASPQAELWQIGPGATVPTPADNTPAEASDEPSEDSTNMPGAPGAEPSSG